MTGLQWTALALCSAMALRDGCVMVRNAWRGTFSHRDVIEFVIATTLTVVLVMHLVVA